MEKLMIMTFIVDSDIYYFYILKPLYVLHTAICIDEHITWNSVIDSFASTNLCVWFIAPIQH